MSSSDLPSRGLRNQETQEAVKFLLSISLRFYRSPAQPGKGLCQSENWGKSQAWRNLWGTQWTGSLWLSRGRGGKARLFPLTFLGYLTSRKQSNRIALKNKEENCRPILVCQFDSDQENKRKSGWKFFIKWKKQTSKQTNTNSRSIFF